MSDRTWPTTQWIDLRVRVRHSGPPLSEGELLHACEVVLNRHDVSLVSVDVAPPQIPTPSLYQQFLNVIGAAGGLAFMAVLVLMALAILVGLSDLVLDWR